jgi:hypothetical protein
MAIALTVGGLPWLSGPKAESGLLGQLIGPTHGSTHQRGHHACAACRGTDGGGSPEALVAQARWHKFNGDPRRMPDMTGGAKSYPGDGVAWRQREGVGAMVLSGGEAHGGQ